MGWAVWYDGRVAGGDWGRGGEEVVFGAWSGARYGWTDGVATNRMPSLGTLIRDSDLEKRGVEWM